jgi:hypothetical protein
MPMLPAQPASHWPEGLVHHVGPVQDPPTQLKHLTAIDIMKSPVVGFDVIVPVAQVKEVLRQTTHNCFPVHTVR